MGQPSTPPHDALAAANLARARGAGDHEALRAAVAALVGPLVPWVFAVTQHGDRRGAGLLALVQAAHRYQPTLGPFEPYAKRTAWREMLAVAVAVAPLPLVGRARAEFRAVLDAADAHGIDLDRADLALLSELTGLASDRVAAAVAVARGPAAQQQLATLPAAPAPAPDRGRTALLQRLLDGLAAPDVWLLRARYGLDGGTPPTRAELAAADPYGRSVEQLRHAEQVLLTALRLRAVDLGPALHHTPDPAEPLTSTSS